MSYISFSKSQLINLEFALTHELLRSNRSGAYSSTTVAGCNTRKYHGLLVVPQPWLDHNNHILLSSLDETIIQHNEAFNFGVRMYPNGVYKPKGHKYLREFTAEPIPKVTYRVGGVVLSKEMLFTENEPRMMIRYTLEDAHSQTILRLKPFLAFRNVHQLTRANIDANNKYEPTQNGVSWQMYHGYSRLYFQTSKPAEYTHVPDWYYNIEYLREKDMGLPFQEDLLVPGFFEVKMKAGESIIVSAGLDDIKPEVLKKMFNAEIKKRIPRNNFENCLLNAAEQFLVKSKNNTEIMAGFPWFGTWGRDTFIALPGVTLSRGDEHSFKAVIDTMIGTMKGPLFPNIGQNNNPDYASVDSPLWFIWCLQQFAAAKNNHLEIWKKYKKTILIILDGFSAGTDYNICMLDNGLLTAGGNGMALTWMDVFSHGKPVTPRSGLAVEVNALWFNAISFALELASVANDRAFIKKWEEIPGRISQSFTDTFWDSSKGYLADYVYEGKQDWTIRPNMLFAVSLPYSPINEEIQISVLKRIKSELLTERGLRSLTPTDPKYKGVYAGNQEERDHSYHQGTVFPWLISHFCEARLKLHGKAGLFLVEELYSNFEAAIFKAGIGSISEIYDGDPPHEPRGAISQAWSVAALIKTKELIEKTKKN
ncbi:MAG: amylo-alpha-1,6-glucosidase [Bacteroidetes bacterium HGW-Bacteroidetes-1]|jgi:predicted glycogen debranching enzyme|nr:MAG: amylo-alpha-1,6-glucosidase [Bacteroidetes bacterium HGW-Bacteroidetes-1]